MCSSDSHGLSILQTDLSATGNNGKKSYQPAIVETFNGKDTKDGVNIIFLVLTNVNQESTDARTDSIMVVNVGNKEGKVKMVSMREHLGSISRGLQKPTILRT